MRTQQLSTCMCFSLLSAILPLAASKSARAERPANLPHSLACPCDLLRSCPDDYCPKPIPCIECFRAKCCPNDFCGKPFPYVRCFQERCFPDCYACKPCPDLCRPIAADHYQCVGRSDFSVKLGSSRTRSETSAVNSMPPNELSTGTEAPTDLPSSSPTVWP